MIRIEKTIQTTLLCFIYTAGKKIACLFVSEVGSIYLAMTGREERPKKCLEVPKGLVFNNTLRSLK